MKHKAAGALVALALFAACGGDDSASPTSPVASDDPPGDGTTTAPGAGTDATTSETTDEVAELLRVGTSTRYTTANPVDMPFSTIGFMAYDALVSTLSGDIEPRLAEAWEFVDDTVIRFTLRDDVTFHDGELLTADDVAFTFNLTKEEGYGNATSLDTFLVATAIDDVTVEIEYATADALALEKVGMIPIMSEAYWADVGGAEGFNAAPNGTGPYEIVDFSPETTIRFERFDEYWGELGRTPSIDLQYFPDQQALLAALESGQIDVAHQLAASAVPVLEGNDDFELVIAFGWGSQMLQLNTTKPPFDDPDLRLAANLAIDNDGLVASLTYSAGFVEDGQVTFPGVNGYDESVTVPPYDVEQAKALVEASDYAGEPVVIVGPTTGVVMEAVAGALAEIGFNVQVDAKEQVAWFEEFQQGSDSNIFYRGMSYTGIFDATRAYRWLHHSEKPFVTDEAWMEMWETQASELDRDMRAGMVEEMTQYIADNNYILFTYSQPAVGATVPGVSGIEWYGIMVRLDQAQLTR